MRQVSLAHFAVALALTACSPAKQPSPGTELAWAYPHAKEGPLPEVPPGLHRIPGSTRVYTGAQLNDEKVAPDWNPEEHPPEPDIVARERPGGPTPCAECHLMNGQGFLAIPNLAGLPASYIVQQVQEFRSGRRRSWEAGRPATQEMIEVSQKVTDQELASAAAYFSRLPLRRWYRVVETDQVPATKPDYYGWLDLVPGGGSEPIGGRIIEVAEDFPRMTMEDPRSGVVVYVPRGAIARGEALVRTGGVGGLACASCHGAALKGVGDIPPLAGRSAAYLARMLWDMKTGARQGPAVAQMQPIAGALSEADITNIAAYLASQKP